MSSSQVHKASAAQQRQLSYLCNVSKLALTRLLENLFLLVLPVIVLAGTKHAELAQSTCLNLTLLHLDCNPEHDSMLWKIDEQLSASACP